ncbi:MAG: LysM peptidoglycan-binding domain-containing protein [Bacteroidetes bacterium]|nr:LysM peptidoglycan-binding domain-containing protein [Bacteroidota bacterium]
MNRLRFVFLLAIISFNLTISSAETIYIQVDEDCIERYEYLINGNTEGDLYVSYTAKSNNGKVAVLEVEKENAKWTKSKPNGLRNCGSFTFTKRLVQKINNNETKVFIVRATDTHYNLTTVKKALFYETMNKSIEVTSKDADFVFNSKNLVSGIDIALPNSNMDVYLEGTITQQCTKGYIIRKSKGFDAKSYKEMTILPEIGIVEKRSITSVRGGERVNILKLDKINHLDYNQYLSDKCTELQAAIIDKKESVAKDNGGFYSADLKDPRKNINTSPSKNKDAVQKMGPCGKSIVEGIHIVEKGQTLYSIARQYGVSVGQVQSWNSLQNSVISPCQELKVATSIAVNRETDNQSKSTTNTTPSQTEASTEKYKESQDHHRVKSGESLRSLAVEYGYTEDRFRWMNGLGATEDIYPGQILRTSDCVCPERTTATEKRPQPYDDTSRIVSGYASKGVSESAPEGTKVYVVREKDTLFSIAKAFNTSVDHLMSLNNLSKGEIILPSQRLYVQ